MTTRVLGDGRRAGAEGRRRWRPLEMGAVIAVLPAALGVVCTISRASLSPLSLAAVSLLFLICLVSALAGLLLGFWIRPSPLARGVQVVGLAWLAICVWMGGSFVLGLVRFALNAAP